MVDGMAGLGNGMNRRRRGRESTIEGILGTARRLLNRGGPAAVTLRGIAREMGVFPAALYRYFPSHDQLLSALRERLFEEARAAMAAGTASPAAAGRSLRRWALGHPHEFIVLFGRRAEHEGAHPRCTPLTAVLGDAMPATAATLGWARLCGLVLLEALGHLPDGDALIEAELAVMAAAPGVPSDVDGRSRV